MCCFICKRELVYIHPKITLPPTTRYVIEGEMLKIFSQSIGFMSGEHWKILVPIHNALERVEDSLVEIHILNVFKHERIEGWIVYKNVQYKYVFMRV
jgi:hypothetical protein